MLLNLAFKQAKLVNCATKSRLAITQLKSISSTRPSLANNLSTFCINPNRHYSSLRVLSTKTTLSSKNSVENKSKLLLVLGNSVKNTFTNRRAMSTTSVNLKLVQSYENIIQSSQDKRLYRGLLLDNGIKCLIVSDPLTDRSAASVDVHAGYMLDPKEFPGLAHFCEHMLFMGSKKVKH